MSYLEAEIVKFDIIIQTVEPSRKEKGQEKGAESFEYNTVSTLNIPRKTTTFPCSVFELSFAYLLRPDTILDILAGHF